MAGSAGLLEHEPDALAELPATDLRVDAEHRDRARVAMPVALENFDGGGLAGAVRTQEPEDLTLLDAEADSADGLDGAIGLA